MERTKKLFNFKKLTRNLPNKLHTIWNWMLWKFLSDMWVLFSALKYIESGEFPELFQLRIEMLTNSGCEDYALNLCHWCTQHEKFSRDIFVRKMQVTLLYKFKRTQEIKKIVSIMIRWSVHWQLTTLVIRLFCIIFYNIPLQPNFFHLLWDHEILL